MKLHFLGDSITFGYNLPPQERWTHLIRQQLPEFTIRNRGIAGDTTNGMLARFLAEVVMEKPDFVHIMGGINDLGFGLSAPNAQANLKALCHQADYYGIQPILGLCPLPHLSQIDPAKVAFMKFESLVEELKKLYAWLEEMNHFSNNPMLIINYEKAFNQHYASFRDQFYLDGVHLNAEGNKAMAEIFLAKTATLFSR